MQADRVRDAALVVLWRHDPYLAGELRRDPLEHFEAGRVDAVVIGQQNAVEHAGASGFCGRPGLASCRDEIEMPGENDLQISPRSINISRIRQPGASP